MYRISYSLRNGPPPEKAYLDLECGECFEAEDQATDQTSNNNLTGRKKFVSQIIAIVTGDKTEETTLAKKQFALVGFYSVVAMYPLFIASIIVRGSVSDKDGIACMIQVLGILFVAIYLFFASL